MDSVEIVYFLSVLGTAMLLGIITGAIAQKKGHSFFEWWLFGTLLFIVALPLALLADTKAATRNSGTKNCPYCSARMKTNVMECPKCHRSQPEIGAATEASWQKVRTDEDPVAKWAKQKGLDDSDAA